MNFEKENIDEQLIRDNRGGFTVPEGYFEKAESEILSKSAFSGFSVPDSYFISLESEILKKTINKPRLSIFYTSHFIKAVTGMAAAILVFTGLFFINYRIDPLRQNMASSETGINNLSDEEIITYVDENDIRDSHIIEVAFNTKDKAQTQVEDYLINNAEEQLIIEEL